MASKDKNNPKSPQGESKQKKVHGIDALADLWSQMNPEPEESDEEQQQAEKFRIREQHREFRNPTYQVISIIAYLIGVEKRHFENPNEPPLIEVYERMDTDKPSRIVRNLCRIRTGLEKNYVNVSRAFQYDVKNIGTIPDLVPSDSVSQLQQDGVSIFRSRPDVDDYLVRINAELSNRINTVAIQFPEWLKWDYIKPIFIMPDGTKPSGIKAAGYQYNSDRARYPYQCWINWSAVAVGSANKGNILFNDEKFVQMLYERHEDRFENLSLVRDAGERTMRHLGELLQSSKKCVIVVDCENSDPIKLAAALSSLPSAERTKISKLLLFDSEYTTATWRTMVDRSLNMAVGAGRFDIEHIVVQRLNQSKSQVDMTLAVRTSREVFANGVDAVILVSSDSDYWAMIRQLEGASFLVMLEKRKTGMAIMDMLALHNILYCYLDDFCTGASYSLKTQTLIHLIQTEIDRTLRGESTTPLNVRAIMEDALSNSWIEMTDREKRAFFERYLQKMKLKVDTDGTVRITIDAD